MKKLIILLLAISLAGLAFADSISTTADLGFVQDFFLKTNSKQFSADVRYCFNDKYELRLPATVSFTSEAQLFDVGLFLDYYPWRNLGLFLGLSLVQFGYVHGETTLEKNLYALNEINLGWTFKLFNGWIIEPSLLIRDPSGTYSEDYELLKGAFPCNRSFRVRISTGWSFNMNK